MYIYDNITVNYFQREKYLENNCRENQNTYSMSIISFRKSCHLLDNVDKYSTATSDYNTALDN